MPEPITIPLTPQQVTEFASIDKQERDLQIARNYLVRGIVLGLHPADVLATSQQRLDLVGGSITLTQP